MPELAELRLTADYINESAKGLKFVNIKKNPVHKGKDISVPFESFENSPTRIFCRKSVCSYSNTSCRPGYIGVRTGWFGGS